MSIFYYFEYFDSFSFYLCVSSVRKKNSMKIYWIVFLKSITTLLQLFKNIVTKTDHFIAKHQSWSDHIHQKFNAVASSIPNLKQFREKFDENFVKISWKSRENFVKTSWKFRENFVKISWKFCENFVKKNLQHIFFLLDLLWLSPVDPSLLWFFAMHTQCKLILKIIEQFQKKVNGSCEKSCQSNSK